jgi:hypothetical protein
MAIFVAQPPTSNDAVKKRTGRTWAEWCAVLDAIGAAQLTHREIVRLLRDKYCADARWSQLITVGYERLRGRRRVNQRAHGFAVSASKTVAAPAAAVFAAWKQPRRRARWMSGVKLTIRKAIPSRLLLITCEHGTNLEVRITAKGAAKSVISVDHTKLPSAEEAAVRKVCWAQMLAALKKYLEG